MDFYVNQHMSVPLSPDFTTVENVLPKIKPLKQEELMISPDDRKISALKSAVTCLGITHFRTDKTVTEPNRSIHRVGGKSDEVLKRRKPLPT